MCCRILKTWPCCWQTKCCGYCNLKHGILLLLIGITLGSLLEVLMMVGVGTPSAKADTKLITDKIEQYEILMAAEKIPKDATDLDRAKLATKNRAKATKMVAKAKLELEKRPKKTEKDMADKPDSKPNDSSPDKPKKPDTSAEVRKIQLVGSILLTNLPRIFATWRAYCKNKQAEGRDTASRYLLYNVWWLTTIICLLQGMYRSNVLGKGGDVTGFRGKV